MPNEENAAAESETGAAAESAAAEEQFDQARAMATIRNLREVEKTGKAVAAERDALRAKLAEIEKSQMTELERTKAQLAEVEAGRTGAVQTVKELRIERAVEREALKLGIIDPEVAARLIDSASIEFDGERPSNIGELLSDLVAAKPYLAPKSTTAQSAGSPVNAARQGAGSGTFTSAQIADRDFWNANKNEILSAMRDGRIVD